jgi:hypothetical protein
MMSNRTVDIDALALDSGDIVLFNRRCSRMSAFGALICASAKVATQSTWDQYVELQHSNRW